MRMRSDVALTAERCETECVHPEHVAPLLNLTIDREQAQRVAEMLSMLADPNRVRILQTLSLADELCVCDLALLVGMNQSAVSHQLRLLRISRVVQPNKVGRIVYYRLADEHIRHVLSDAIDHTSQPGGHR